MSGDSYRLNQSKRQRHTRPSKLNDPLAPHLLNINIVYKKVNTLSDGSSLPQSLMTIGRFEVPVPYINAVKGLFFHNVTLRKWFVFALAQWSIITP
jgi:hypothetical protein